MGNPGPARRKEQIRHHTSPRHTEWRTALWRASRPRGACAPSSGVLIPGRWQSSHVVELELWGLGEPPPEVGVVRREPERNLARLEEGKPRVGGRPRPSWSSTNSRAKVTRSTELEPLGKPGAARCAIGGCVTRAACNRTIPVRPRGEEMPMSIGETIQSARKSAGLTQEQLAARVYVTRQAVSRWETGESEPGIDPSRRPAPSSGCRDRAGCTRTGASAAWWRSDSPAPHAYAKSSAAFAIRSMTPTPNGQRLSHPPQPTHSSAWWSSAR